VKLNIQTDFTSFPRAATVLRAGEKHEAPAAGRVALAHDERRLRRRALPLAEGGRILADFAEPTDLASGDRLVLDDGRQIEITAAEEEVLEVRGRDGAHLAELAWHIGERHLAAAVSDGRILIERDADAKAALEALGATVRETAAPFEPLRTTVHHDHGHHHGHDHHHGHGHDHHGHGEPDKYGRLPGDPHYGHNHA
jgi:urease accessory protein